MNKPSWTLALIAAGTLFLTAPAVAQKPIELNFGSWHASTAAIPVGAFEPWKKLVEEKTNGRVHVTVHNGAVLGGSRTVLEDVRGGVYDVGFAVPTYYYDTSYYPLLIGELPFAIPDSGVGTDVMQEFAKKYEKQVFGPLGIKNMGVTVSDPYGLYTKEPVRNLAELKNKRVRVSGKLFVGLMKDWGAVPSSIAAEDMYTALDRGTIDGTLYSVVGAAGWKLPEVAPYMIDLKTPVVVINLVMNQRFYDALPDDLKKLFDEELNPALTNLVGKSVYSDGRTKAVEQFKAEVAKRGKGEYIPLTDQTRAEFVQPSKPIWDDWVKEANKRGFDGDAMMKDFKAILEAHHVTPPF